MNRSSAAPLFISVLGPVRVEVGGKSVAVGGPRRQALIARLAIERQRVVSAAALADTVWDGALLSQVQTNLHAMVSKLRRSLEQAGAPPLLRTAAPGYFLDVDDWCCDADIFASLRRSGLDALAAGAADRAVVELEQALSQWNGEAFANLRTIGYFDRIGRALDNERRETLSALVDARLSASRYNEAVADLQALVRDDPYADRHWSRLIWALALAGRQSEARQACRQMRLLHHQELGLDPSPALLELEKQVHAGQLGPVAGPSLRTTVGALPDALRRGRLRRASDNAAFPIGRAGLRIGRAPDNDIVIDREDVSRYHAEVLHTRAGLVVRDRGSLNLTQLRGVDLPRGAIELLNSGDEICICGVSLIFEAEH
ncbi:FHA domain-containing protein [Nocardia sp. NEAU-G5]|uniref:FHA domain-containing protein n=1 Tax=Nocardia albiluteola TaxID=2842303 RepID=A0ABS6B2H3_9NOCA|nr:FHA domain-containing protein [Nocardia albiluteola]